MTYTDDASMEMASPAAFDLNDGVYIPEFWAEKSITLAFNSGMEPTPAAYFNS